MKTYAIVIGVVKFRDKVLFLKRTPTRSSNPNKWQPVSGYLGEKEDAAEAVLREVKEETGLDGKITKAGKVFEVIDDYGRWISIPFLVAVDSDKVKIDPEEHSEHKWIKPEEFSKLDYIPGAKKDLESVELL